MRLDNLRQEEFIAGALLIVAAWTWVNVEATIGAFYLAMTLIYFMTVGSRRFSEIELIVTRQDIGKAFIGAGVVLVAWIIASMWIFQETGGQVSLGFTSEAFTAFFRQLALFTQVPVLADDPTIKFMMFGGTIPIIESLFFLSFVLLFWAKLLSVPIRWHNVNSPYFVRMLMVCVLVGASGMLFHLTARSLNDIALGIDVLFFSVSAFIVFASASRIPLIGGDGKVNMFKGVLFHVFVNSLVLIVGGA